MKGSDIISRHFKPVRENKYCGDNLLYHLPLKVSNFSKKKKKLLIPSSELH